MSKKNFSKGLGSLIQNTNVAPKPKIEKAPQLKASVQPKSNKKSEVLARTSVMVSEDILEQVRALAYWERKKIQDVLSESMIEHLNKKDPKVLKQALEAYQSKCS
ncbi:MAG: hypothetical protein P0S95_07695 [Rhabdochlamydiaceae bacterium]|nr:hypothetical protein [Candidatus Amphrikana amoebophyrae]